MEATNFNFSSWEIDLTNFGAVDVEVDTLSLYLISYLSPNDLVILMIPFNFCDPITILMIVDED